MFWAGNGIVYVNRDLLDRLVCDKTIKKKQKKNSNYIFWHVIAIKGLFDRIRKLVPLFQFSQPNSGFTLLYAIRIVYKSYILQLVISKDYVLKKVSLNVSQEMKHRGG